MESLISWGLTELQTNDMLTGIMGGSLFAAMLYQLRAVPRIIWSIIVVLTTSEIRLVSDKNEDFDDVLMYFQNKEPLFRHAKFSMITKHDDETDGLKNFVGIGYGNHFFSVGGTLFRVGYQAEEQSNYGQIRESITITALTRKGRQCFGHLAEQITNTKGDQHRAFFYTGFWRKIRGVQPRPLSTVFLPEEKKVKICDSIQNFLGEKSWYIDKGIPYRLSFLFSGKPGTGKTSTALALATEFNLPLYYMALGSVDDDSDLMDAMRSVPPRSIVVIEDIDCAESSNKRKKIKKRDSIEKDEDKEGITLSGLLNSIDGILAPQGRILIMTTNHPEVLDEALVRKGRVDHEICFDAHHKSYANIFRRIAPDKELPEKISEMTPAEIQAEAIEAMS